MKVLIIARCKGGKYSPFISEQTDALKAAGANCVWFGVNGNGFWGYLRHLPELKRAIRVFQPDIIHAHYGLCGLLANLQRKVPVITTYHGSDINNPHILKLSKLAIRLSAYNIFVSQRNIDIAKPKGMNYALIPCGINLDDYPFYDKADARRQMHLETDIKYVLFSGAFDNRVKNAPLAEAAINLLPNVQLLELKGYSRPQVATLMHAVDALLMTSFTEGSPQVIKEAMACECPIVSVDVGDVKEIIEGVNGCILSERNPESIAKNLLYAIGVDRTNKGRDAIIEKGLSNSIIASKILRIYSLALEQR